MKLAGRCENGAEGRGALELRPCTVPVRAGGAPSGIGRISQALCCRNCHIRKTRDGKHVSRESGLEIRILAESGE